MSKITDPDNLTYSVNSATNMLRTDTTAKTIQLVAGGALVAVDGVTGQCLFSKIKEVIKASSVLISVPLPIREMIHDESMELVNGWTFADTTTIKMIRDCGVAYGQTISTDPIGTTTVTFSGVNAGSEIRVYLPDGTEVAGIESCAANQALTWSVYAGGSPNNTVRVVVVNTAYKIKEFEYTVTLGNQSLPIQQEADKWYSNPV